MGCVALCKTAQIEFAQGSEGAGTGAEAAHGARSLEPGAQSLLSLRRRAYSPSLRQSAVSTRASTTTTLASMARVGGSGRIEAGHRVVARAESESAAAGRARLAL